MWTRASGTDLSEVTQVPDGLLLALSSAVVGDTDQYTCTVADVSGNNISQSIGIAVLSKKLHESKPQPPCTYCLQQSPTKYVAMIMLYGVPPSLPLSPHTVPPSFTTVPSSVSGAIDESLKEELLCAAEGVPPPSITWLRPDLTPFPGAPVFDPLTREDAGTYTCLAANSAGEIQTQFTITVEGL